MWIALSLAYSTRSCSRQFNWSRSTWWLFVWTSLANWNRSTKWTTYETYQYSTSWTRSISQTKFVHSYDPIFFEYWSILAADRGPFIRSYDENNGRTVFRYSPETCGYVSVEESINANDQIVLSCSLFVLESVVVEKVVEKQLFHSEMPMIQLFYLNLVLKVEISRKQFKCKHDRRWMDCRHHFLVLFSKGRIRLWTLSSLWSVHQTKYSMVLFSSTKYSSR